MAGYDAHTAGYLHFCVWEQQNMYCLYCTNISKGTVYVGHSKSNRIVFAKTA